MNNLPNKAFVPICLYSDGFFLEKENLKFFLHTFRDYNEILFLIVDTLYGINLLIKEKVKDEKEGNTSADKRGGDILNYTNNTIKDYYFHHTDQEQIITVLRWDDFAKKEDFKLLYKNISSCIKGNHKLNSYCEDFIHYNLERLTKNINQEKLLLEEKYLFSEITMSILLTEFKGFNTEVWEKPPNPDMVDPINILYTKSKQVLKKIIKKDKLEREQIYLKDLFKTGHYLTQSKSEIKHRQT